MKLISKTNVLDWCDECKTQKADIVQIGEEPNYESFTAYVCRECLIKAVELIDHIATE